MIHVTRDPSPPVPTISASLWTGDRYESTFIGRVSVGLRPRPAIGVRVTWQDEDPRVSVGLTLGYSLYLTLPWFRQLGAWLRGRECCLSLVLSQDMRLPALYLTLSVFRDILRGTDAGHFMVDLLSLVLGRWNADRESMDWWSGVVQMARHDGGVDKVPVKATLERWTARWPRQWWAPAVQWSLDVRADGDGWEDAVRPWKGRISAASAPLVDEVPIDEAVLDFVARHNAGMASMSANRVTDG